MNTLKNALHTSKGREITHDNPAEMKAQGYRCVRHLYGTLLDGDMDARIDALVLLYSPSAPRFTVAAHGVDVWFSLYDLAASQNLPITINCAIITTAAVPACGLSAETIRIEGIIADPSVFPPTMRKQYVESVRQTLSRSFQELLGEPVTVFLGGWDSPPVAKAS
jgi:hypothetical protein